MDEQLNHRFYQPGTIRFDPDLAAGIHADGTELALRLDGGETSLLPDAVEGWLLLHTAAVNGKAMGILRGQIAAELDSPPYDDEKARRIGSLMRDTIAVTTDFGNRLAEVSRRIEERTRGEEPGQDSSDNT